MSRLAEQLQKLHKPVASMGFGFASASVTRRQMLILVSFGDSDSGDEADACLSLADAAVVVSGAQGSESLLQIANARPGGIPTGVWAVESQVAADGLPDCRCDFLVSDISGPARVMAAKGVGLVVRVECDMEAARLRAIGDLGVEALVLDARALDLRRLSSVVECRRVRASSGRPLLIEIEALPEPGLLNVLWQAGVDGLVVKASLGIEALASLRATLDSVTFESRSGSRGPAAAIGAYVGAMSQPHSEHDDEGEEEEDDDDDEE